MALLPATSFAPAMPAVPRGSELEAFSVCGCSPPGAAHGGHTQPHGSHGRSVLRWGAARPQPQPRLWCHPCGQARGWAQLCVLARVSGSSLLAIQRSDHPQGHGGTPTTVTTSTGSLLSPRWHPAMQVAASPCDARGSGHPPGRQPWVHIRARRGARWERERSTQALCLAGVGGSQGVGSEC